jgi:hypothetical protein
MREPPRKRNGVVVTGCLAIIGELGVRAPLRGYVCCFHWIRSNAREAGGGIKPGAQAPG